MTFDLSDEPESERVRLFECWLTVWYSKKAKRHDWLPNRLEVGMKEFGLRQKVSKQAIQDVEKRIACRHIYLKECAQFVKLRTGVEVKDVPIKRYEPLRVLTAA